MQQATHMALRQRGQGFFWGTVPEIVCNPLVGHGLLVKEMCRLKKKKKKEVCEELQCT